MATCTETLADLASQLSGVINSPTSDSEKTAAATAIAKQILKATKGAAPDWMERACSNVEVASMKLFLDWGAFEAIPEQGTITFSELAKKLNADVALIRRITWVLVAGGILRQYGDDQIAHTSLSRQYLPENTDGLFLQMIFDEHMLPALKLPEYFSQYGRHEPVERLRTPHAYALGQPDKEIWEIQKQYPERMKRFMKAMEISQTFLPTIGIYDFSWVKSKLSEDPDRIVFVDVGGGKGHTIKAVLEENPFMPPARMMLEDRDEVIEEVIQMKEPELKDIQFKVHDFHQVQPVKNALIYNIRRCLHDYGDDVCANILTQLSGAMASDSKLLIGEFVLANPPSPLGAMTDLYMMEVGGKERTAQDWEVLVARAGLKIERIHGLGKAIQVLECIRS